jgi:hypothetical protein
MSCAVEVSVRRSKRRDRRVHPAPNSTPTQDRSPHSRSVVGVIRATALHLILGCLLACLASPPVRAGGFQGDNAATTSPDHFEIDIANLYSRMKGETSGALASIEVDYGVAKEVELHLYAPLAFDRKAGMGHTRYGYGDTELGVKYRFLDQDENGWLPAIATFPIIEIPTGNAQSGLGTGHTHGFVPLWFQRDFGRWMAFGGVDYELNPGAGNKNNWEVSLALGRTISDSFWLGVEVFHQTSTSDRAKPSTGFNIGGTYDLTTNHHLLLTVGRGIQNPTHTNQFSSYLAYELTF